MANLSAQSVGVPAEPYSMMVGGWKETRVAIHGPNGHIASGLTIEQAKPIIEELNRLHSLRETLKD